MITYKLFRTKNGKLYPLYVEANREMEVGKWLNAGTGERVDDTHVKANGCGGKLSLRPGFHSTKIPFTDWIGKKMPDGSLAQKTDTVWCECEVEDKPVECKEKNGFRDLSFDGYYIFKTNSKQRDPWIISTRIKINRVLDKAEIAKICLSNGIQPQPMAV